VFKPFTIGVTVEGLLVVSCKARTSSGWAESPPTFSSPMPSSTPPAATLDGLAGGAIKPGSGAVYPPVSAAML